MMTPCGKPSVWVCVVVIVVACSVATGQIVRTQDGRLRDKNPQVGSGGSNRVQGGSGGVSSQLYETGTLRGRTAQIQFGHLRDRNTQIGSGGYNVVVGGDRGVSTQLFLNRTRSALALFRGDVPYTQLRAVQKGGPNVVAGSGINASINTRIIDQTVIRKIYAQYDAVPRIQHGQRLSDVVPVIPRIGNITPPPETIAADTPLPTSVDAPGPADLFGSGASKARRRLATELSQMQTDPRIDLRVPTQFPKHQEEQKAPEKSGEEQADVSALQAAAGRLERQGDEPADADSTAKGQRLQPGQRTIQPGQQVFVDILMEIKRLRDSPLRQIEAQEAAAAKAAAEAAAEAAKRGEQPHQPVDRQGEQIVVRSLSGTQQSRFNRYTREGYELLGKRRFYQAVDAYDLAVMVQPSDPLGYLGQGVALLAAGETTTAARQFRTVLAMFPALMESDVRFDLPALIHPKNVDVLEKRRTAVNERLVDTQYPETTLTFLATFLHYNLDRPVDARFFATRLQRVAGEDKVYQQYARFVLSKTDAADRKAR